MEDMPWGAEDVVLTTDVDSGDGALAVRRVHIDRDEMTAYHYHRHRNEIVFVQEGLLEIRLEDDYAEVGENGAFFIEAGEPHQLQNIDDSVTEVLEIAMPFSPDDVEMLEDPYADLR
ncbi:MAG: cupin domain-containing protein [Candidatus Nanohaloarchaea archaeon]|nr:cupin domain-containing protein [Candidatus Nanohaloarchaea archaeon]